MSPRQTLLLLLLAASIGAPAPAADAQEAPAILQAIVERGELDDLRWPRFAELTPALVALYEPRGWAPLWLDDAVPTAQAREAIAVLVEADAHGLDARDYDAAPLDTEMHRIARDRHPPAEAQAHFDAALSVALMRHLSDVRVGRVDPRSLGFGYDPASKQLDLAAVVASAVRDDRIAAAVDEARPPFAERRLLEEQLARQREIAADASLAPPQIALGPKRKKIVAGGALPEAADLMRWLVAHGDLEGDAVVPALYEGGLVDAVRRFQARHGLDVDGVIGAGTAKALAVPASVRVRQIELALERLRWLPDVAGERVVVVNVPSFELAAYDAVGPDATPALQMAVIFGRAVRTETPIFVGTMRTVVFAPYWNVPRSILRNEILPKLAKNPSYLVQENMEIVMRGNAVATNADTIGALASGGARVRQRPGAKNSLGRVKFLFPNRYDVYLHDTPSRSLFLRARRDFSHGCIRVAEPEALARWVLGPEGWDDARVAAGLALTRETSVPLAHPIPVVVYYTTAVARSDGTIGFYDDVYRRDAALEAALAEGGRYRR